MTLKYPLPISCSRLKSHQTKEQTKKIEVPFLPLRAQYTSTLWQGGGGGVLSIESEETQERGG